MSFLSWRNWCGGVLLGWGTLGWFVNTDSIQAGDIVDTAAKAGEFKNLVAAVQAADLVKTLQGKGPFTVFAPQDAAFAKLPSSALESLLEPKNKATLTNVLTYHVVAGEYTAADLTKKSGLVTVNGQRIEFKAQDGGLSVDNAKVVTADIRCDNGVIHVIDTVLMPESQTIPKVAASTEKFKTLLKAAESAKLVETLSGKGPITLFAPTDEAFAKLPKGTVEGLLQPENREKLVAILTYHVVAGRVYSDDVAGIESAASVEGSPLKVTAKDGEIFINKSKVLMTDIDASNGVIHVIDTVLLPPMKNVGAKKVLETVVAKGSDLFNSGHHESCAKLYRGTMEKLMSAELPKEVKTHMARTISKAEHLDCPTQQAWALRHGIDEMYQMLGDTTK
jgi:transforming growth factor-beta-induced protein